MVARPEDYIWSSYRARAGFATCPDWLTIDPLLSQFGADRESQQQAYRTFVLERIGDTEDLLDRAVAQIYLGTAAWIERVQALIDETERSEEFPRAQVHPGRPELEDVIAAVASTFDTTPEAIAASHGTLERRLVAWFAFEEGLVPLRRIASGSASQAPEASRRSFPAAGRSLPAILRSTRSPRLAAAGCAAGRRPSCFPPRSRPSPPATTTEQPHARDGSGALEPMRTNIDISLAGPEIV